MDCIKLEERFECMAIHNQDLFLGFQYKVKRPNKVSSSSLSSLSSILLCLLLCLQFFCAHTTTSVRAHTHTHTHASSSSSSEEYILWTTLTTKKKTTLTTIEKKTYTKRATPLLRKVKRARVCFGKRNFCSLFSPIRFWRRLSLCEHCSSILSSSEI